MYVIWCVNVCVGKSLIVSTGLSQSLQFEAKVLTSHSSLSSHTHLRSNRGFSKWEALEATADLAYNCPENREELGQHDAIHLVVKSIERVSQQIAIRACLCSDLSPPSFHPQQQNLEDPVTLDIACMALTNLVQDSPENVSRLEGQTLRIRGRDRRISIYVLLTTILPDKTVRGERSCIIMMALSILCANNSEAQTQAGNAGACQIVVDKIRSEIHDGTVVRQG